MAGGRYNIMKNDIIERITDNLLPLYEKNFPIIFFWSPKSGCTSLLKWYLFQIGVLKIAIDYNPWVHFYREQVHERQDHYHLNIKEALFNNRKDTYKLVRNPYTRAVSSFLAVFQNKGIMDEAFSTSNNSLSFKRFLYNVQKIGIEREFINPHIAQQYVEQEELFIQKYIKLEDFTKELQAIELKYNLLPSPIDTIIKSPHHMTSIMNKDEKRSFSEIEMSLSSFPTSIPSYEQFYDEESKALVKELFKTDFVKYGY